MSHNSYIRWLYQELPELVRSGTLAPEAAEKLKTHYGPPPAGAGRRVALTVCGILGATLIGGGIILLFAHNWSALSRSTRTVLALAPLLATHILTLWALATGRTSRVWRESTGMLVTLMLAAAIALVGQTYHIPGNLANFLLVWMLLTLPLIYLLEATVPALIYLPGITAWAGLAQVEYGHAVWFLPLLALVLPHLALVLRRDPYGSRATFLGWMLVICLFVATGESLEKILPGLWIIVYGALATGFYLAGRRWMAAAPSTWRNPFASAGALGIVVIALLLTYDEFWNNVGWRHWRTGWAYNWRVGTLDYLILAGLSAVSTWMLLHTARRRDVLGLAFGALLPVTVLGYLLASSGFEGPAIILCNAYLLALVLTITVTGLRENRTGLVNGGLLTLSTLIVARFFDEEFSFVMRGCAFIAIGIAFLIANVLMSRRGKGAAP